MASEDVEGRGSETKGVTTDQGDGKRERDSSREKHKHWLSYKILRGVIARKKIMRLRKKIKSISQRYFDWIKEKTFHRCLRLPKARV